MWRGTLAKVRHVVPSAPIASQTRIVGASGIMNSYRASLLLAAHSMLLAHGLNQSQKLAVHQSRGNYPPMGARGFWPQKICVPSAAINCTSTRLSTIDLAVALPTPTGPPSAL